MSELPRDAGVRNRIFSKLRPGSRDRITRQRAARSRAFHAEALEVRSLLSVVNLTGNTINGVEGQQLPVLTPGAILATFDDPQNHGAYSVTVDFGDGTSDPGALALLNVNGTGHYEVYSFSGKAYLEEGNYVTKIGVTDIIDQSNATANGQAIIADAPLINPVSPTITPTQGAPFTGTIFTFTDTNPNGAAIDYTAQINWGDGTPVSAAATFVPLGGGSFAVQATHTYASPGVYNRSITVLDHGAFVQGTGQSRVQDAPIVPGSAKGTPVTAVEGKLFAQQVATFQDSNPASLPSNWSATINWGDGSSSAGFITPFGAGYQVIGVHTYSEEGSKPVSVTVTSTDVPPGSGITPTSFTVNTTATINDAPLTGFSAIAGSAVEDSAFANQSLATFVDTYSLAPLSDYQWAGAVSIDWGDGSTSGGTVTQPGGTGAPFLVSGGHTYATPGAYQPTITITDIGGASITGKGSITVADAPITAAGVTLSPHPVEGSAAPWTGTVATVTDADRSGSKNDLSATVNWGDGTADVVPGSSFTLVSGGGGVSPPTWNIPGSHTYREEGTYTVTVFVTSTFGSSASAASTAIVDDAPLSPQALTFNAVVAQPFTGVVVGKFQDANKFAIPADFIPVSAGGEGGLVTINWGDGTTSTADTVQAVSPATNPPTFQVLASHSYTNSGSFPVVITVKDAGGQSTTINSTVNVTRPPLAGQAVNFTATEGITDVNQVVGTFYNPNPFGSQNPADYTATINWGDGGATEAGTVVLIGPNTFNVVGSHKYADVKNYNVTVTLKENAPGAAPATTVIDQAHVVDAPLSATGLTFNATEGAPFSGQVATLFDQDTTNTTGGFNITINWADGSSSAGTAAYDHFDSVNQVQVFKVNGTHTYLSYGVYTPVTVSIVSAGIPAGFTPSTATATSTAVVADAALTATGTAFKTAAGANPIEGNSVTGVVATFTDANPLGTAADKYAWINWGDGTPLDTTTAVITQTGTAPPTFSVKGTHTYIEEGNYSITVTIGSFGGSTATASSTAAVADGAIKATGNQVATTQENAAYTGLIATFTDQNPLAPVADFVPVSAGGEGGSVSVNWGDGTTEVLPASSILKTGVVGGLSQFGIFGTHVYATPTTGPGGAAYNVVVTVLDAGGMSDTTTSTPTKISVTDAPISVSAKPLTGVEGTPLTNVLVATMSDSDLDPATPASEFSATIDWGDGSTGPGTIVKLAAPGQFEVRGTHLYQLEGIYATKVTVTSIYGATANSSSTATIQDAALTPAATQPDLVGSPFTEGQARTGIAVATFVSANPFDTADHFIASINWGDGTASAGTVTLVSSNATSSTFSVSLVGTPQQKVYLEEGTYPIVVSVVDTYGPFASSTLVNNTAKVVDAPLSIAGLTQPSISATEGTAFSGAVATFNDTNPLAPISDFTTAPGGVTINWGDGSATTTGTVSQPGGVGKPFVISGTHLYDNVGTYTVTVNVKDEGGQTLSIVRTVTVGDATITPLGAPRTLTALEGNPTGNQILGFFQSGAPKDTTANFTVTVNWGDGTTEVVGTPGANVSLVNPSPGFFYVQGNHTYAEAGTYPVTVTVKSNEGSQQISPPSVTFNVADAPLVPSTTPIQIQGFSGVPLANPNNPTPGNQVVIGVFTDLNPIAPLSDYSAQINWGDGSPVDTVASFLKVADGTTNVLGNHTYAGPGVYNVTVVVKDVEGATTTLASTFVTIQPPPAPLMAGASSQAASSAANGAAIDSLMTSGFSVRSDNGAILALLGDSGPGLSASQKKK